MCGQHDGEEEEESGGEGLGGVVSGEGEGRSSVHIFFF